MKMLEDVNAAHGDMVNNHVITVKSVSLVQSATTRYEITSQIVISAKSVRVSITGKETIHG